MRVSYIWESRRLIHEAGNVRNVRKPKRLTGESMSSRRSTEQRSHCSSVSARCMIFLTIFSRSVCSSNRSLTTSSKACGNKNHTQILKDLTQKGKWARMGCNTSQLLTLLLSYSLRDSENSFALEIDIPQNGRYICSTWVKEQEKWWNMCTNEVTGFNVGKRSIRLWVMMSVRSHDGVSFISAQMSLV